MKVRHRSGKWPEAVFVLAKAAMMGTHTHSSHSACLRSWWESSGTSMYGPCLQPWQPAWRHSDARGVPCHVGIQILSCLPQPVHTSAHHLFSHRPTADSQSLH